ncbi:MAG TPA: hypothetical protein VFH21_04830 [Burkholderiales bacterium]|jgi:membrane protein|nr:hypothetical protein [Burkholderiales bacterium]
MQRTSGSLTARRASAAPALYSLFSLAPMLIIVVAITGCFLGEQRRAGISQQNSGLIGTDAAQVVEAMRARRADPGVLI